MKPTEDDFPVRDTERPTDPFGQEPPPESFGKMPKFETVFPDDAGQIFERLEVLGKSLERLHRDYRATAANIDGVFDQTRSMNEWLIQHLKTTHQNHLAIQHNLGLVADQVFGQNHRPKTWKSMVQFFDTIPSPPPG